jgi:hypothetical protein
MFEAVAIRTAAATIKLRHMRDTTGARAPIVRVLVTSRDVPGIRSRMEVLRASRLNITAGTVDSVTGRYVSSQLTRDRELSRLDVRMRTPIKDTLSNRGNEMQALNGVVVRPSADVSLLSRFRWDFCQPQELKKSKSTGSNSVKEPLLASPKTLD